MDTSALLMMLAQQAPRLLAAIQANGGVESVPGIADALSKGMDAGLMESRLPNMATGATTLSNVDVLDSMYSEPDIQQAFPSDGAGSGLSNLFSTVNPEQWKHIGGPQAALSAATFENSPMPDDEFLSGFDEPSIEENLPWSDSDMDDIHSSEMWQAGKKFNPSLRDWYRKNKR